MFTLCSVYILIKEKQIWSFTILTTMLLLVKLRFPISTYLAFSAFKACIYCSKTQFSTNVSMPNVHFSWLRSHMLSVVSLADSSLPITSHWDFIRTLQHKNCGIKRLWDDQSEIVGHLIKRQTLFKSTRSLLDKTHRTCFLCTGGWKIAIFDGCVLTKSKQYIHFNILINGIVEPFRFEQYCVCEHNK